MLGIRVFWAYVVLVWVSVMATQLYDLWYAYINEDIFLNFEVNPIARVIYVNYGLWGLTTLKVCSIIAGLMALYMCIKYEEKLLTFFYTTIVAFCHIFLIGIYVIASII